MNFVNDHEQEILYAINQWYQIPGILDFPVINLPKKTMFNALPVLTTILLEFSQNDSYQRLHSEFKLFDRLYIQSRFQIRSFPYLKTLKKNRQTLKKFFSLSLREKVENIASAKLTNSTLISKQSFESLQWLFLASYELLKQIESQAMNLSEQLTQEMTTNVFLHFPIVFISLAGSFSTICEQYKEICLETFCQLRTIDQQNVIQFPIDPNCFALPPLPWDDSFNMKLDGIVIQQIPKNLATPKPHIAKIDFTISAKPNTQLRGKISNMGKKPKSALDSLGF